MQKTIEHVSDIVVAKCSQWSALIKQTAVAAAPLMATEAPDENALHELLVDIMATQTDMVLLYGFSNIPWSQPGGFAAISTDWRPNTDWDNTIRNWFTGAKAKNGQISYAAPYIDTVTGKLTTAISINVYDKQKPKQDRGVVSGNVSIGFLDDMLYENSSLPEQQTFFLNSQGLFITNPNSALVLKNDFFTDTGLERYRSSVLSASSFSMMDKEVFIYSVVIPEVDWILVSIIPTSVIFAEVNHLLLIIIGASIGVVLLSAVVTFLVTQKISQPFTALEQCAAVLAEGDFSQTSPDYVLKESSLLSLGFNTINKNISSLIKTLERKVTLINQLGTELAERMNGSATNLSGIRITVRGIKEKSSDQAASVEESNAAISQIVGNIEGLNGYIEKQAASISRSSAAIEEMTANVAQITQTLMQNGENVERLQVAAGKGHTALQQMTSAIQEVEKESDHLFEINQVIENIASQTNLLSMNAAIEAAHAGEVGKGFAVVASEIRKLAESSSRQAKTVSDVLKNIKQSLDGIGRSSEAMVTHFDDIDKEVNIVSVQEACIRNAMEEEDAGNKELLETLGALIEITGYVKRSSEEMLTGSQEIITHEEQLSSMTTELTDNINGIATSIEHISNAVLRAEEISDENKQSITVLIKAISRFTIRDTWLPNGRKDQLTMAKKWNEVLKIKGTEWTVPPAEVTELTTLTAAADTTLTEAQRSKRTPAITAKCKTVFKALAEKMRAVNNQYFLSPPLREADFATLDLKSRDTNHSLVSSSATSSQVEADVSPIGAHRLELHLRLASGAPLDSHPSDYRYRIYYGILPLRGSRSPVDAEAKRELIQVPTTSNDLPFSQFTRRQQEVFDFVQEDSGKTAYFCIRYENVKGESGPWGPIFSAVIP
jgi:methyl-accepting chemotaxis protein